MQRVKRLAALTALTFATGLVSAQAVNEYSSLTSWDSAVNGVTTHTIPTPTFESDGVAIPLSVSLFAGEHGQTIGPGTFATPGNVGVIYNDGLYGNNVSYVSADPGAFLGGPATVAISFGASSDVTALAFDLGSDRSNATIDVSVNGSSFAPVTVSSNSPTAFLGITDTKGPITSIVFTDPNNRGEMDVIGAYETGTVKAPEIDPASTMGAMTLLLGGLVVLRGRRSDHPRHLEN